MTRIRIWALALLIIVPAHLTAADETTNLAAPPPAETEQRVNIDWKGGPLKDLAKVLEQQQANLMIPDELAAVRIPGFRFQRVTVDEIMSVLDALKRDEGIRFQGLSKPKIWVAIRIPARPGKCAVHYIGDLLKAYKLEDISTSIKTALTMADAKTQGILSFHAETKLLIAAASDQELPLIKQVIDELRRGMEADQPAKN